MSEITLNSKAGFNPEGFSELFKLESKHFWFNARNLLLAWAKQKYFKNAEKFFEIGCGTGFVLNYFEKQFPSLETYGSDLYPEGLEFAKTRLKRSKIFTMDARAIPFSEKFDLIGSFDVLEHIEEDLDVLAQIHKALRPKGGLMLTVPQHPFLWSVLDDYACHVRRYRKKELQIKLERSGFEVLYLSSFMSLLFPLMLVSRIRQKNIDQIDPTSELKIGAFTNKILKSILDIERFLIQKGMKFPFGGSLLAVAVKK